MSHSAAITRRAARAEPWTGWVAAGALALALHGAWWWYARNWTTPVASIGSATSARLQWWPPAEPDAAPAQLLWSPVLFALPSEVGFSRSGVGPDAPPRPSLRANRERAVLLDAPAGPAFPLPDYLPSVEDTVRAHVWDWAPTAGGPVFDLAGRTTGFVLRVSWPDGQPALRASGVGLEALAPWLDEKPWEALAYLQFSEQGTVRSVFLEKATASRDRNEALARGLRRLRVDPSERPFACRVLLQYDRVAQAAPESP
jgi:hypothetical protein